MVVIPIAARKHDWTAFGDRVLTNDCCLSMFADVIPETDNGQNIIAQRVARSLHK